MRKVSPLTRTLAGATFPSRGEVKRHLFLAEKDQNVGGKP
jgi:hypothetical protein